MKAIVVEIHKEKAVVLSDNSCFETVKNNNYEIGQVIIMKKQKISIMKTAMAATAAVVMLSFGSWAYVSPYTYISLDVNPSIEFTLNRFNRVIDVKAINDDGSDILADLKENIRNNSIDDAIEETVEKIKENGYFEDTDITFTVDKEENAMEKITENDTKNDIENDQDDNKYDGGIIITVSNNNVKLSEELTDKLRSIVEESVGEDVSVEVASIGKDRVEEAKELGVSPGKLRLVEKMQESSSETIIYSEWIDKPVKEIMSAIKANKKAEEKIIEEAQETEEKIIEEAQETEEKAKEEAEKAEEKAREKAKKAREEVKKAEEKARKESKKVEEKAREEAKKAEEKVREEAKKTEEKAREEAGKAYENNRDDD